MNWTRRSVRRARSGVARLHGNTARASAIDTALAIASYSPEASGRRLRTRQCQMVLHSTKRPDHAERRPQRRRMTDPPPAPTATAHGSPVGASSERFLQPPLTTERGRGGGGTVRICGHHADSADDTTTAGRAALRPRRIARPRSHARHHRARVRIRAMPSTTITGRRRERPGSPNGAKGRVAPLQARSGLAVVGRGRSGSRLPRPGYQR